jgi:DedD protein
MALLKFLRRPGSSTDTASAGASSAAEQAVQAARQQARRRLLGAVVLLGVGIIGFPLVFQTQPRPIPVDIPIEIPNRDKVAPMGAAAPVAEAPAQAPPVQEPPVQVPPVLGEAPAGKAAPAVVAAEATKPANAPVEVEVLPPSRAEAAGPTGKEAQKDPQKDAQKDTQRDNDKDRGRFVVQAGSYTDVDAVREVRNKLERMGLKTYTQAAVIEGVTRVRVRVGPFNSKQEAQDVQNKIKAAGVAASLLQL